MRQAETAQAAAIAAGTLRASGISLYVLLLDAALPRAAELFDLPPTRDPSGRFETSTRTIEGWRLYQVRLADQGSTQPEVALADVAPLLVEMLAVAQASAGEAPGQSVAYVIAAIHELHGADARAGRYAGVSLEDVLGSLEAKVGVRGILDTFDPLPPRPGEPRGYYYQYDEVLQREGYLAVGPRASVLVDLSDHSFEVLAVRLQGGEIAPTGGLTREGLRTVLARIDQWSANQDVQKSVDQVIALKKSGDDSTRGQVWLAYALAVIGIALSFLSYIQKPIYMGPGLLILGLSCVASARHAQEGDALSSRVGRALFWLGVALTITGGAIGALGVKLPYLPF